MTKAKTSPRTGAIASQSQQLQDKVHERNDNNESMIDVEAALFFGCVVVNE